MSYELGQLNSQTRKQGLGSCQNIALLASSLLKCADSSAVYRLKVDSWFQALGAKCQTDSVLHCTALRKLYAVRPSPWQCAALLMVLSHALVLFHPFEVCHSDSTSSGFQVSKKSLCAKPVVALICIINSLFCKLLLRHLLRPSAVC